MKLIDLLVQELPKRGGWPEGVKSIQQCRDGQIWHDDEPAYRLEPSEDTRPCGISFDDFDIRVYREQYEAALQQPVWNGEGLPPVGCECDVIPHNNRWGFLGGGAYTGVVIAYDGEDFWFKDNNGVHTVSRTDKVNFHAIRTEADRKRELVLKSLMVTVAGFMTTEDYILAENIYDAIAAGKIPGVTLL